jgi:hypothetical protein
MQELISNIKLYLTSLEPNLAQGIYSQSIGGYPSNTLLYQETTLANTIGLYEDVLQLDTPASGTWGDWSTVHYLSIGSEIIKVKEVTNNNINIVQRGVNNLINMHIAGNEVWGLPDTGLFNNVLNEDYEQYRCIAVKNISDSVVGSNVYVYIRQNSQNSNTKIKMAIEVPQSCDIEGTSSSWDSIKLTDASLIGSYDNNYFKDAYLRILSGPNIGQNRLISSYDGSTGVFIFYDSLPVDFSSIYSSLVSYEVEPSPAQRIKSGTESPVVNTDYVTNFLEAEKNFPISLNVTNSSRKGDFYPNDIFYIWLQRTLSKNATNFDDNSVIITINYTIPETSA